MSSKPWIPFYVGDFLADTAHLETIEIGAYLLLICHYWRTGPLPADESRLRNICRLSRHNFSKSKAVILKFFVLENEKYLHKRIDSEIAKAIDISTVKAESGRRGGLAKAVANSKQKRTQSQSQSQSHIKKNNTSSNDFERWWAIYPKKVSKKKAKAIWMRIKPDTDILIANVQDRLASDSRWKAGYIKDPTGYLNGELWNDEIQIDAPAELPKDLEGLMAYASKHGLPEARPGESLWDWRSRLQEQSR